MSEDPITKAELLADIQQGWDDFHAFLAAYSRDQLSTLKDAVGWTPQDHIVHLAVWEDSITALLSGQSQREGLGLDEATWASDYDHQNAVLRERYLALSLDEALDLFQQSHARLIAKIEALSDEDLQRPYSHYVPDFDREQPVIGWIIGDTYEHYQEHQPWIAAIVDEE